MTIGIGDNLRKQSFRDAKIEITIIVGIRYSEKLPTTGNLIHKILK